MNLIIWQVLAAALLPIHPLYIITLQLTCCLRAHYHPIEASASCILGPFCARTLSDTPVPAFNSEVSDSHHSVHQQLQYDCSETGSSLFYLDFGQGLLPPALPIFFCDLTRSTASHFPAGSATFSFANSSP